MKKITFVVCSRMYTACGNRNLTILTAFNTIQSCDIVFVRSKILLPLEFVCPTKLSYHKLAATACTVSVYLYFYTSDSASFTLSQAYNTHD